ncbi:TIM barrel protein [bacterium]|nr:TIM barrel protein [bacterium]
MRLGGPLLQTYQEPDQWVSALKSLGYSACFCPPATDSVTIADYAAAAAAADILVAEVGVWNNPLSTNQHQRLAAIRDCKEKLALADEIGAVCCVNIAGSRGDRWDGPHPANLTNETFEMIVSTVRDIIDAVQPKRTFYVLETMPWIFPNSAESYLQLFHAIDRPAFGVHFDPVNLISSPERYFNNAALILEFVTLLGAYIKSVHLKDIYLQPRLTTHLYEVRPGMGMLNYPILLRSLSGLSRDLPLMLEHLDMDEDYYQAAEFIRDTARAVGVELR